MRSFSVESASQPEVKTFIRALAQREQITESALIKELLAVVLRSSAAKGLPKLEELQRTSRDSRLYVRLNPNDRLAPIAEVWELGSPARPPGGQGSQRGAQAAEYPQGALRSWRRQFVAHLRAQGIAANATERAVRGQTRGPVWDGIYRAALRGHPTYRRARLERIVQAARSGRAAPEPGGMKLQETRRAVVQGWHTVADRMVSPIWRSRSGSSSAACRRPGPRMSACGVTSQRLWTAIDDRTAMREVADA
jgi:hypothetical protein